VREGADQLCRDVGAHNLLLDTEIDEGRGECRIWLSEPTMGGGGIVEEFTRRYSEDPRRFFRLVESALGPSDFEIVDSELSRTLNLAVEDTPVRACLLRVRAAQSHAQTQDAVRSLLALLVDRGVAVSHPVSAALNARVLRPGSTADTDRFIRDLVVRWRSEEERLGIEIDARVFAFGASASDEVDHLLAAVPSAIDGRRQWRFATIYGLLWPRGAAVRASALRAYNPYHPQPPTDRALVLSALPNETAEVRLGGPGWKEQLAAALIDGGGCLLRADADQSRDLRQAIIELQAIPIDVGYLMLHPRVIGFARQDGDLFIHLELREAFQ